MPGSLAMFRCCHARREEQRRRERESRRGDMRKRRAAFDVQVSLAPRGRRSRQRRRSYALVSTGGALDQLFRCQRASPWRAHVEVAAGALRGSTYGARSPIVWLGEVSDASCHRDALSTCLFVVDRPARELPPTMPGRNSACGLCGMRPTNTPCGSGVTCRWLGSGFRGSPRSICTASTSDTVSG